MSKIKYGLKNVYYAVATIAADGSATYAAPVALPGAVSLTRNARGERSTFYADNIIWWEGNANDGYEGDLVLADIPDSFKKDVLGYIEDTNKVLTEDVDAPTVHFALLFQFEKDTKAARHVLYNVTVSRPSENSETKNNQINPQTSTLNYSASSVYNSARQKNVTKAETVETTNATTYNGWFEAVYQAGAAA